MVNNMSYYVKNLKINTLIFLFKNKYCINKLNFNFILKFKFLFFNGSWNKSQI